MSKYEAPNCSEQSECECEVQKSSEISSFFFLHFSVRCRTDVNKVHVSVRCRMVLNKLHVSVRCRTVLNKVHANVRRRTVLNEVHANVRSRTVAIKAHACVRCRTDVSVKVVTDIYESHKRMMSCCVKW